ncbi:YhdP family protein [Chelativorans sp. YIM 93263]|uniref:YhdP family protein n=1 Tax=Chelativorans sp. YIM 93263 TaxID=2906648 RepID=UPI0023793B8B|nr:DUF3971 domain-containing protein [Chelativorans sp. YIM 93263]
MKQEPSDQNRNWYSHHDPAPTEGLSSASCVQRVSGKRSWVAKILRGFLWFAYVAVAIISLLAAALYVVGQGSVGNDRLRFYAERTITDLVGFHVDVGLGEVHLGLGTSSLFAFEVRDVSITRADNGDTLALVGRLRFGLRAFPLLKGELELTRLSIAGAVLPAGMPIPGGREVTTPKEASHAVFGAANRIFSVTDRLRAVDLSDVRLVLSEKRPELVISRLELRRQDHEHVIAEGVAHIGERHIYVDGIAQRDEDGGGELSIELSSPVGENEPRGSGTIRSLGAVDISIVGHRAGAAGESAVVVDAKLGEALLGFDKDEMSVDSLHARLAFRGTAEAFSLVVAPVEVGRSVMKLHGTISPDRDRTPSYRFDLVSRDSIIAPIDSPESQLPFAFRLSGQFTPEARLLEAEEISLRTSAGEVAASAAITMPQDVSPGIALSVYIADLPTAHAKQFWPWFAAAGARNWTLRHVFGGRVYDSTLQLSVPPDRLGNGVPLSREELGGRFNLADTRFDIAGEMPPVRDGNGWVAFRGTDVDVGLTSGAIYMPSNRVVNVGTGSLTIDDAHLKPRIGQLRIGVSGDASAISQLAAYQPVNASRFYDFAPDELSGNASGHIRADIPLQDGIPVADLDWRVDLRYENLAIAQPVNGQEVSDAFGSLLVEPDRAEIAANARLNGVPAAIQLVEPFGESRIERVRDIELQVNDTSREDVAPGLGQFVSGPFTVEYQELTGGRKRLTVVLDDARLTIPWIRWEKPPGIPAAATFFMEQDGEAVQISQFALTGEDLLISGTMRFSRGRLQEADLDRVQLSRNDDFTASIRTDAEGAYSVAVRGSTLDARTVIEDILDEGRQGSGGPAANYSVRLDAQFSRVVGHNDRILEQVEFQGSFGDGTDGFSGKAATPDFGSFSFEKTEVSSRTIVRASTSNAGAVLAFLDIYGQVDRGQLSATLTGAGSGLSGKIDMRDFYVVDEPQLDFLVSSSSRGRTSAGEVDTSRVFFDTGTAEISMNRGGVQIADGVLRGPLMGSTFQGVLHDASGNISLTGTFMPFYGFNRIFGEIPIIGQILGNGQDGGLIGITYRLSGKFSDPTLNVNPISAIAPGVFRQIFEYR